MKRYVATITIDHPGEFTLRDLDDMTNGLRWVVKDCGAIAHQVSVHEQTLGLPAETHPLVYGEQLTVVDL